MKTSKSATMYARVEEWKQSGQSLREFAKTIGMSKSVLEYWVRRRRTLSQVSSPGFVELAAESSYREIPVHFQSLRHKERSGVAIEITLPGGVTVKISGQMLGLSANLRYFLCCQATDMRNGFDGLAGIVRNYLRKDPVSGDVFIFLNRSRTHIKLLYWDGDGFALFYKRLERGRYDQCTALNGLTREMKREELMMLLEGLSYGDMHRKKRFRIG